MVTPNIKAALGSLQEQIHHRFPTREDIQTALEGLQQQLDQRFCAEKKIQECQHDERDKRLSVELAERDKAVHVLDQHIREQVKVGDENLKQHIENQIQQLKASLESAEKLEITRITMVEAKVDDLNTSGHQQIESRIAGVQREIVLVNTASEKAIEKAEIATNDKFKAANGYQEQFRNLINTLMPRVEAEKAYNANRDALFAFKDEVTRAINELKSYQSTVAGRGQGLNQGYGYIIAGVGMVGTLVVILVGLFTWVGSIKGTQDVNTEFRKKAEPIIQQAP